MNDIGNLNQCGESYPMGDLPTPSYDDNVQGGSNTVSDTDSTPKGGDSNYDD